MHSAQAIDVLLSFRENGQAKINILRIGYFCIEQATYEAGNIDTVWGR